MPKRNRPTRPDAAAPVPTEEQRPVSARRECYDRILWEIRQGFAAYAEAHPERVGDARWGDGLECSMEGLGKIVAVLEQYDIECAGTVEELREEVRRLRALCGDLRWRLDAKERNGEAE